MLPERDGQSISGPQPFEFDRSTIQQYLAFGFVSFARPDEDRLALVKEWSGRPRRLAGEVQEDDLISEGVTALAAAVSQCGSEQTVSGQQVVLLSGGLDSRAILSSLLREFNRSEIVAATFGQPGERDFDYATRVAKAAGVEHVRLESFAAEWSTEGLVDSILARRVPLPYPFGQRYLSYVLYRDLGITNNFWDGLSGDTISGKSWPSVTSWEQIVDVWLRRQLVPGWRQLVGSPESTGPGSSEKVDAFDPRSVVPAVPLLPEAQLSYFDQISIAMDETDYFATRIMRGYSVQTPFLRRPWLDFMLGVPLEYRIDQRMYMDVLKRLDPVLFSLPLTTFDGGSLTESSWRRARRSDRQRLRRRLARARLMSPAPQQAGGANDAIRQRHTKPGVIRQIFVENLADLAARDVVPWLDVESYLDGGPRRDAAYRALNGLLGLELNLKAIDRIAVQTTDDQSAR